ncbi:hypothetical protein FPQ18DRAFT_368985 [Pyronema domesticum]|nr:hypothetical protein FPQ18DRAFT_368985 [Pyronema domesticum]
MASAEYYSGDPNRPNQVPLQHTASTASAYSRNSSYAPPPGTSVDINKPLPPPHTSPFLPQHNYNQDDLSYAPHHYSSHSIDTGYHPQNSYDDPRDHSPGKYGDVTPPHLQGGNPFSDNIPLQDTNKPLMQPPNNQQSQAEYGFAPRRPVRQLQKKQPRPWFVYFITAVQIAVFCGQLARNAQLQGGSPIGIKPQFNPMIGPSTDVMVSMGARFVPCMRYVEGFKNNDPTMKYPCPGRKDLYLQCTLGDWCGFGGQDIPEEMGGTGPKGSTPNQWYRFIIPMFYHAGLIHLLFNMFIQVWMGGEMERQIGMVRFMIVYFSSGIFGFVLGGNLGAHGQPSVGASGSLFGIFALQMLDILYTWRERRSPGKDFGFLLLDIVISFVLGLLPAIDNFAHIGGFLCGLALGLSVMRSPNQLRARISDNEPPYTAATPGNPYNNSSGETELIGFRGFIKQPIGFFKGRKPLWWAWWGVRLCCLVLTVVVFAVLLNNFYAEKMKECGWCKYLSCLPVNGWCDMYNGFKTENVTVGADGKPIAQRSLEGMANLAGMGGF